MRTLQNILLTVILFIHFLLSAQTSSTAWDVFKRPSFGYRSNENPYYWKNRPPFAGYWQQDVHYKINAEIDEKTNTISGDLTLTYYNNSSDSLPFVYFHLYQEIFQPGSYLDKLNQANNAMPRFGEHESEGHVMDVETVNIINLNNATTQKATLTQDFSVLKVDLHETILPGDSITFQIPFKSYFDNGSLRRRMKVYDAYGYKHFDGVHWYPRICVYDSKFGWDTDQHLGKEFYGNFGTYEVALTFASNFIVDATGYLENANDVMPSSLREKLDIKNFQNKPWEEPPSTIIPYIEGDKKTWKYYAVNVHDFAFTADPTYRIGDAMAVVKGRSVLCRALVQEPHAAHWQNAADYTSKIIETFSRDFGEYIWPKIIVADARDGMEYPMLTLDGGFDPAYRDLLIHEVGHMWFFGMIGNNETYRAALDEGFTQFLTAWGYRAIDGDNRISLPQRSKYAENFREPENIMMSEVYFGYLNDAVRQNDAPLNTHSDMFNSALGHGGGYRHVYFKTATMLYNLQYVLGDELFLDAMKHYVSQWRLCHPYFEDFRNSIINYTNVDLNWFFDQWLETTKNIDYGINCVKLKGKQQVEGQQLFNYEIEFERKGSMQMPIDFAVILDSGDTLPYHIPNTWFNKIENPEVVETGSLNQSNVENVTVLPKWYGWDLLNKEYTAGIITSQKIKQVIIDPSNRLADINKLDNYWKTLIDWKFDANIFNYPNWNEYEIKWRPDVWYNAYDGIKAGLHFNGNYLNYKHLFELTAWYNTGLGQGGFYGDSLTQEIPDNEANNLDIASFDFDYKTSTDKFLNNSNFFFSVKYLDGVLGLSTGFEKYLSRNLRDRITFYTENLYVKNNLYLYNYELIEEAKWNNSVNIEYYHNYSYAGGNGNLLLGLRANSVYSDYDFSKLYAEAIHSNALGKFDLRTRIFAQAGSGNNVPFESSVLLAGANTEEMLDNKFTRSRGWFPDEWVTFGQTTNHFHMGGGLNIRGYAGYLIVEEDEEGNIYSAFSGVSAASINAELEFDRLFKFKIIRALKFEPYIFADAGILSVDKYLNQLSSLRADAGAGAALTLNWFGPLETVRPLTFRVDFPVFLNHPPFEEKDYVKFRYIIAVNRAF
jgi:aminopeptidase N